MQYNKSTKTQLSSGQLSLRQPASSCVDKWQWTKTDAAKKLFSMCRMLHVYLSISFFGLLVFFSLTGFTLNHANWFKGKPVESTTMHLMPEYIVDALLPSANTENRDKSPQLDIPTLLLTQYANENWRLINPKKVTTDMESVEVVVEFANPSGKAILTFSPLIKQVQLTYQRKNLISLLGTLHKGKRVGFVWSLLIDITAFIVFFFAITGMYILFQNKKYRGQGLVLAILGIATPIALYVFTVPSF